MPSSNDYDWLGDGIYFWEHNAQRAYDFAVMMSDQPHPSGQKIKKPAVVGAVINLGHCLNLLDRPGFIGGGLKKLVCHRLLNQENPPARPGAEGQTRSLKT